MSDKELILKRISKNKPKFISLPEEISGNITSSIEQLKDKFAKSLISVGAEVIELNGEDEVDYYIKTQHKEAIDFRKPESLSMYSYDCPKNELDKIDTAILYGLFGVAENGAIWLDESTFPNRLIPFIAQQLIIIIKKEQLVKDMHDAYDNIFLDKDGYGVFISGPSKTADIEQSLVYGAHGAKQLFVIMY